MADTSRSLEDIRNSVQHVSADLNTVKKAIADLCDQMIAERDRIAKLAEAAAAGGTPIVRAPDGKVYL